MKRRDSLESQGIAIARAGSCENKAAALALEQLTCDAAILLLSGFLDKTSVGINPIQVFLKALKPVRALGVCL